MSNRNRTKTDSQFDLFDRPYVLLVLAILFWSGNFILGRAVRAEVPPIGLAFWRWFVGSLIVLPFALPYLKPELLQVFRHWKIILLFSALGIATFNTLVYIGLHSTTAINGSLIQSITPLAIALLSYLLFRDTLSLVQVIGIAISLSGVIVITMRGSWQTLTTLSFNPGDGLILTAVSCYAFYVSLLRLRPAIHPLSFLAVTFALGTLMLLPFYAWENLTGHIMRLNPVTVLSISYVGIFPSILAYFCYDRGVLLIGANQAGQFLNLIPLFSSVMAVLFLGETFQLFHGIGMILILGGIFLVTTGRYRRTD